MAETVALIVAAGRGERAGGGVPKQFRQLAGKPVLRWTIEAFRTHPQVDAVQTVIHGDDRQRYEAAAEGSGLDNPVIGGATRADSVRNGLDALGRSPPRRVLIHDGARPLVSSSLISRVINALDSADAAAPFLPMADTLRRRTAGGYETVPRDGLLRAQTPQGFRFDKIWDAHRRFAGESVTDDLALAERANLTIAAVAGEETNIKLTTADDFVAAEKLALSSLLDVRTGTGFDAHRFGAGDHVWLCGVKIPHSASLVGHSDADVGLHALTDAILGALGAADIGAHFPPSEERWRGAPSHLFLEHAAELARKRGGFISHVDVTLICERPKVGPHRETMRARLAEILRIDIGRVSVKATTSDGLGFTGRSEGIAAQAVATIRLPA
jgi:2-C-methyl-D-erythritol 4-phosphate cytidylyltransferase / 2-C-methyl-D-erythritol 2,4-cyclodiphosphate synthase